MSNSTQMKATAAVLLTLGMNGAAIAPFLTPTAAFAQTSGFRDVPSSYWAKDFIEELADRGVIAGFPDGTFRPEAPVTRAQFASMVAAFNEPQERSAITFRDVASNYWATPAIRKAYETGFLTGYPNNYFRPDLNIPREQVLVSLAAGLDYTLQGSQSQLLSNYLDASNISSYATDEIAATTERKVVVNYPNVEYLNPTRSATRAEVAAFIYQALVNEGQAPTISSRFIVSPTPVATEFRIPSGTQIPVAYEREKILLTEDESAEITLTVDANITTRDGQLLIPANSEIVGDLTPADGGTQFVAKEIIFPDGETLAISAVSDVISDTEIIRKGGNITTLIKNAAIGTGAAAAIAGVTGDRAIATEELLIGAGVGALGTLIQRFIGRNSVELIVIDPETDLDLTLTRDLVVSAQR
ncbi:S-layer homology domain-containing protein [Oscillatoria salina]|uniref:S-layer homology domain-containing protein n=1 Tax=Oscillatoria salina TaxID=331517 RepID=UPI0013BD9F87|nr:S-layer homology domain-containing protein [Oscillatoria salina]MBZ8181353.1 S-layer homology domain-containing protein [Oscillatoria salina IIICB1]NET89750.1 S-layer homology domain-containing protein [Kamptonema sp. SIO1D9]